MSYCSWNVSVQYVLNATQVFCAWVLFFQTTYLSAYSLLRPIVVCPAQTSLKPNHPFLLSSASCWNFPIRQMHAAITIVSSKGSLNLTSFFSIILSFIFPRSCWTWSRISMISILLSPVIFPLFRWWEMAGWLDWIVFLWNRRLYWSKKTVAPHYVPLHVVILWRGKRSPQLWRRIYLDGGERRSARRYEKIILHRSFLGQGGHRREHRMLLRQCLGFDRPTFVISPIVCSLCLPLLWLVRRLAFVTWRRIPFWWCTFLWHSS